MKVLITGGAGYVGSTLTGLLLKKGYHVKVLDNLMYTGAGILPYFAHTRFEFVKGDVRDAQVMADSISDCDIIIHLAAIVGFPACLRNPTLATEVNTGSAVTLAKLAENRLVLYASTGSNYGAVPDGLCTEETMLNPLSIYAVTKANAEAHLLANCNTIAYRFATGFGLSPRMRLDLLVNDFVFKAKTMRYLVVYEKEFMRSFIHVRDMANAFLFGIQNGDKMSGQIYNVGDETMNCSKQHICELIESKTDCYMHYAAAGSDPDKRDYQVSYKKIASLGYHTTITIEQGIDELVRGMDALDVKSQYTNL